ncbi:MAG: TIM barrel protein [Chloroflexota bacterium]
MKFSANLGFLWNDRPLPDAIRAAKAAGFHAVECHFPYDQDVNHVNAALVETGLPMLGLNTSPGNMATGEFGRSSLPGREADAQADINQAIGYAVAINCENIHVLAGISQGCEAMAVFKANLKYAYEKAAEHGINILIEPLNPRSNPGYFLNKSGMAADIIADLNLPNLKLMFDCYHIQMIESNVTNRIKGLLPLIGHIQFAGVPDRHEPNTGELAYERLIPAIYEMGYDGYIGAEYRPRTTVEAGLDWLKNFSS